MYAALAARAGYRVGVIAHGMNPNTYREQGHAMWFCEYHAAIKATLFVPKDHFQQRSGETELIDEQLIEVDEGVVDFAACQARVGAD